MAAFPPLCDFGWSAVYRIHATVRVDGEATSAPGTVESVLKDSFVVATGRGLLAVTAIQAPGKRVMDTCDFLRGHRLVPGVQFQDIN